MKRKLTKSHYEKAKEQTQKKPPQVLLSPTTLCGKPLGLANPAGSAREGLTAKGEARIIKAQK